MQAVEQLSDQCPSRWALAQALSLFLGLLSLCCKIHNRCVSSQRRWMLGFVLPFRQGLLIPPPPINFRLSSRFLWCWRASISESLLWAPAGSRDVKSRLFGQGFRQHTNTSGKLHYPDVWGFTSKIMTAWNFSTCFSGLTSRWILSWWLSVKPPWIFVCVRAWWLENSIISPSWCGERPQLEEKKPKMAA